MSRLRHALVDAVLTGIFLALAGLLVWRFLATGGLPMLRHMNDAEAPGDTAHAAHAHA
jgi:hypothetical protein